MIGIPGNGKTTLAEVAFPDHVHISLDALKRFPASRRHKLQRRCEKGEPPHAMGLSRNRRMEYVMVHDALKGDRNIVIDDTNVTEEIRSVHISLAQEYGASIKAIFFTNTQQAYVRNAGRKGRLDDAVLDRFLGKMEPPRMSEGFEFIQHITW